MKLSRRLRSLAAFLALVGVLFSQLALATYACPGAQEMALAAEQTRGADFVLRLDLHERFMKCGGAALIPGGRDAVQAAWPQIEQSLRAAAQRKAGGR